jgi:hypothetical protein
MAGSRRPPQQQPADDDAPTCYRCKGKGWLDFKVVEVDGDSVAVLEACECDKGRQMAKDQRERDERFKQYAGARPAA